MNVRVSEIPESASNRPRILSRSLSLKVVTPSKPNQCLSCGTSEKMGKKRYCSVECRQKLRRQLDVRSGLLKALNTRYAAFYFTDALLVLDVLPHGSGEIFSFLFPRSARRKPVEDFGRMTDKLGSVWWDEIRRTNKRYLASRLVLSQAKTRIISLDTVKPRVVRKPALIGKSLTRLKLDPSQLSSPELLQAVKVAFRRQAMEHHPDVGGDAATFRKIYQAYEQILCWAENPVYRKQRGLPEKWFYDGERNRWSQPAAHPLE